MEDSTSIDPNQQFLKRNMAHGSKLLEINYLTRPPFVSKDLPFFPNHHLLYYILLLLWHSISRLCCSHLTFLQPCFLDKMLIKCHPTHDASLRMQASLLYSRKLKHNKSLHKRAGPPTQTGKFTKFVFDTISKLYLPIKQSRTTYFLQMFCVHHLFFPA